MIKILVPFFLVLFLNNVSAEDLDGLDQDLKLLKSNLSLLSDRIALTDDEVVTLSHIDVLMADVKAIISSLDKDRSRYEAYFSDIEVSRATVQWKRRDTEFDLGDTSEEGKEKVEQWEYGTENSVNDKEYLYDSVACPGQYSLDEWRQMRIGYRRIRTISCTIEAERDEIAKLYSEYLVENAELKGEVTMTFSIDGNGLITMKQSKSSLPLGLNTLIVERFSKIKFPALGLNNMDLEYTFDFKP